MLVISEKDIRRNSPHKNLIRLLWQQWRTEHKLAKEQLLASEGREHDVDR